MTTEKQTQLNVWLLSPEDLVKYFNPQNNHERVLFDALKDTLEKLESISSENEAELAELQERIDNLEGSEARLEDDLSKYVDFFEYISDAYRKVDGTWPKCEIDNDAWAVAIYDHIVGNDGS